jgi:membrane-bound metal-dependent hydrolase YbcI (DUF457 family)
MRGDTHLLAGAAFGVVAGLTDPVSWGALLFGSLLPDIDHHASPIGRCVPFVQKLAGHRGLLHSVTVGMGLGVAVHPWLGIGYLLHELLDTFNPSGGKFLWPFVPDRIKCPWGVIRTGSGGELLVRALLVSIIVARLF